MAADADRMSALEAAARRGMYIAQAQVERKRREIADEADALPGLNAHVEGEDIVIEGRGLLERWIRDASLRNIGRAGA
jgi:hypothetical protein